MKLYLVDNPRGSLMVAMYRVAHMASVMRKKSKLAWLWAVPVLVLYRFITEFVLGYEIPAALIVGPGLMIDHGYGIVINKHAIIGSHCRIKHGVTIGCKTMPDGSQGGSPRIGNYVDIGAGAIILGSIEIGDHVLIGAGAIVTKSVPSHATVRSKVSECYV